MEQPCGASRASIANIANSPNGDFHTHYGRGQTHHTAINKCVPPRESGFGTTLDEAFVHIRHVHLRVVDNSTTAAPFGPETT